MRATDPGEAYQSYKLYDNVHLAQIEPHNSPYEKTNSYISKLGKIPSMNNYSFSFGFL